MLVQCENKTFPQSYTVMHKVSDLVVDLVSRVVSKKKPLQLRKGLIVVALLVGGYSLPGINLTTYLQCQKPLLLFHLYWFFVYPPWFQSYVC